MSHNKSLFNNKKLHCVKYCVTTYRLHASMICKIAESLSDVWRSCQKTLAHLIIVKCRWKVDSLYYIITHIKVYLLRITNKVIFIDYQRFKFKKKCKRERKNYMYTQKRRWRTKINFIFSIAHFCFSNRAIFLIEWKFWFGSVEWLCIVFYFINQKFSKIDIFAIYLSIQKCA